MMRPVTIPEAAPFFFERGPVGVLLLHGFTSTPFEVRELGERLAGAGVTALGPVLPGHRTTPEDLADTPWRDWFDATRTGIAQLKTVVNEVLLIGSSAGAALSLHAAAHDPSLRGVVALGTVIRIRTASACLLRLVARVVPFLPKRGGSSIRDPKARALHPAYEKVPVRAVVALSEFLDHLVADLPDVQAPVLMIHARSDSVASPQDIPFIFDRLGSGQKSVVWVENSDHIITEDFDKEQVFRHVLQFVQQHSSWAKPEK